MKRLRTMALVSVVLGSAFFIASVTTSFTSPRQLLSVSPMYLILLNLASGALSVPLGYASVQLVGGHLSISLASALSRATGSKQIVEIRKPGTDRVKLQNIHLVLPQLVTFVLAMAIAFDIFTLDRSGLLPFVRPLDIFTLNIRAAPALRALDVLPVLIFLIGIAGLVPSLVLPYFDRLKITGVNSSPFHTGFLFTVVGIVAGASVLLTLASFFYRVLFSSGEPVYYHYAVLTLAGLSFFYGAGSYIGLGRAGDKLIDKLKSRDKKDGVFIGSVSID